MQTLQELTISEIQVKPHIKQGRKNKSSKSLQNPAKKDPAGHTRGENTGRAIPESQELAAAKKPDRKRRDGSQETRKRIEETPKQETRPPAAIRQGVISDRAVFKEPRRL